MGALRGARGAGAANAGNVEKFLEDAILTCADLDALENPEKRWWRNV